MTAPDHADLRALAEVATPGPWGRASTPNTGFAVHRGVHQTVALYANRDDASYIAAASPDRVLALLDEVARLRAAVERVEAREAFHEVFAALLDESDDIEGTRLNLGDEMPRVWVHTTEQVCDWLRDRLPIALRAALTDPERGPVHNHPPYDPPCNERLVDGQLRGVCLTDPEETDA